MEIKCGWIDCRFNLDGVCSQRDGGGTAYGMNTIGRHKHEKQSEEIKKYCRCCIPDLGQQYTYNALIQDFIQINRNLCDSKSFWNPDDGILNNGYPFELSFEEVVSNMLDLRDETKGFRCSTVKETVYNAREEFAGSFQKAYEILLEIKNSKKYTEVFNRKAEECRISFSNTKEKNIYAWLSNYSNWLSCFNEKSTLGYCEELELIKDNVKICWINIGEGINGDYDENNPEDINLLRFDVYVLEDGDWIAVDDASYCTNVPSNTGKEELEKLLETLMNEFYNVLHDDIHASVKKLGERMSHISL